MHSDRRTGFWSCSVSEHDDINSDNVQIPLSGFRMAFGCHKTMVLEVYGPSSSSHGVLGSVRVVFIDFQFDVSASFIHTASIRT